jgi:predicted dehydrogenase
MSGGLIADMGIHDFDVARMYMGDVKTVHAIGGALAHPEMKAIGDIDNAIVNMIFENGTLGVVHLSRNACSGTTSAPKSGGPRDPYRSVSPAYPILLMTEGGISHDVVPHFMQRFESAYLAQIQSFVDAVLGGGSRRSRAPMR